MPSAYNDTLYRQYKNKLTQLIKTAEKNHYANVIEKSKNNLQKMWSILKSIINRNKKKSIQSKFRLNNGTVITDGLQISEKFNDFFTGIGPSLAKKIPEQTVSPDQYLGDRLLNSIYLSPVTENEIYKIVQSLKNSAPGHDEISPQTLKSSVNYILSPLTHICNLSLQQGIFPNEMKIANVLPLYKADDPMAFNNYRPVSILCCISKVFEKMMYSRLLDFLNTYKILVEYQFGFRKQHSTYMALLALMDELTKALENKDYVVGIFLDFSKAFDTVNHIILLHKLYHYGVRGSALLWFESYLSGRKQYVTYNGVASTVKTIECGVPQGSILGPLLFLIYINDLAKVSKNLMSILFADDTNMFNKGKNPMEIQTTINTELEHVSLWLKVNKLSLNIKKTHFMVFSNKPTYNLNLDIRIDGHR